MCGIGGVVLLRGVVEELTLDLMGKALAHRGPDDQGIWLSPRGDVGFTHQRLSIIDLSVAGHQPMVSDDGQVVLVFNGEIYNFRELRQVLQEHGHRFKSLSDTEVVMRAYEEWGTAALKKFNGMFALAIWDAQRGEIVLARDRFGEKPLFFFLRSDMFIFASELKALKAVPEFPGNIASEVLPLYFTFGYVPYPQTIFEHTWKLEPGHYMVLDVDSLQVQIEPYWEITHNIGAGMETIGMGDGVAKLDELLTDAVQSRLVADVPVGAFLSGGVDSSLIVSIMAGLQADLKTFTIGFGEEVYDEAGYAREIARHIGTSHHEHYVSPREAIEVLLRLPDLYDEPFADSSAIPTYLVSNFAKESVKVVLSGDGGDELFGGYTTYPYMAWASLLDKIPPSFKGVVARMMSVISPEKLRRHRAFFEQGELWEIFLYLNERAIGKKPDVAKLLLTENSQMLFDSNFVQTFKATEGLGGLQAAFYTDSQTFLIDDSMVKMDRASMAESLEARVPFLDYRVVDFAMRLPIRHKMGTLRLQRKVILRELLAKYLPPVLFERPKRGFSLPMAVWLRGELSWLLEEYLSPKRLQREGLFDIGFVESLKSEHLSGRRDRNALLWALVFWEMWRERWDIK